MKKSFIAIMFILSITMFAVASADGGAVYAKCKGCHGADGSKIPLGVASAVLKGQSVDAIENKLKGYKKGTYGGIKKSTMVSQAGKLSEDEIEAVAKFIAKF